MFDADARVLAHNAAALRLFDAHTSLRLSALPGIPGDAQRLTGPDGPLQTCIEQAVHECAMSASRSPRAGVAPERSAKTLHLAQADAATGLVLHVSAIVDAARAANGAVLGRLAELRRPLRLDCTRLAELFDLSASSARVAEAYLRSDTVKDVARELGISTNTVKTHLATVYAHTRCSRQSQLIRLLMTLSARGAG